MKPTFKRRLWAALLLIGTVCDAHAGLLEETCDFVYKRLDSGPQIRLTKSIGRFIEGGKAYRGCVIRLSGDANKVKTTQRPDGLFGSPLPYCPDGDLPVGLPRDFVNPYGWCGDRMADGPDGQSVMAIKNNVFCFVEGRWDGGDDSDSRHEPSSRYTIMVKCAYR